jgi:hypothetical protein
MNFVSQKKSPPSYPAVTQGGVHANLPGKLYAIFEIAAEQMPNSPHVARRHTHLSDRTAVISVP